MKFVIAGTGASGAIYLQRLLHYLDPAEHEVHLVLSNYAKVVVAEELESGLRIPAGVHTHGLKSMNAPFASGSALFDAMVVIPCSMGTMGRMAAGTSEDLLLRAADVFLKERRKLILVPRETPWNLIHLRNATTLTEAGAMILPASPGFYHRPTTVEELADTVVWRVLDHMGITAHRGPRWKEAAEETDA